MRKKGNLIDIPNDIPETEVAYAAGIFDGEGCISITKQNAGRCGRINVSHRLFIKITMGHRPTIDWLKNTFKVGSVTVQKHKKYNDGYNWWVAANEAIEILRLFRPFLKVKAKEADLASEFSNITWDQGKLRTLPPKVVSERERYYHLMQEAKPSHRFRVS